MVDVQSVLEGNRLALSRLLSQIENDTLEGRQALAALFPHTGRAKLIGVTGAPGTGKSSLVNQIAYHLRNPEEGEPKKVAVVAVDPSSPFTGGAVLGDRIRMSSLSGDKGVFIRSMASRGSLGGLAWATAGIVQAFDAAGYDVVLIETVGAGQAEVEIARLAHTTLVVEAPGLGDDIQAIKAGILEIADILVVNKADRPGVENTERALKTMLQLANSTNRSDDQLVWETPIQCTVATDGQGVGELIEQISNHQAFLEKTGGLTERVRTRLAAELDLRLREGLITKWKERSADGLYEEMLDQLVDRKISPQEAVDQMVNGGNGK
jgi:LAO/AO transport system kinase